MDYSTNFQKNDSTFDVDWLLHQVENEVTVAEQELAALRNHIWAFLGYETAAAQDAHRSPKAAPLARVALNSVGLFGSGIALGEGFCGIKGSFGSFHDKSKSNAGVFQNLVDFTEASTEDVFNLRNKLNDKFLMLASELAAIKSVQKEMLQVQNRIWKIVEEHFEVFQDKIQVLRDCDQLVFSRQQVNFIYDLISALLAITFAKIKSCRGAVYTYRINMLNSIQPVLNRNWPMSLVPRQSLSAFPESIAAEQSRSKDRLSLAIPMDE